MGPVSPVVAAALADRAADEAEDSAARDLAHYARTERTGSDDLFAMSDQALHALIASGTHVGKEFAARRELRRRFLRAVDGA